MDARMMYLHAISPVHTGTGQAVDVIDLPVAREVTTGWPYIPGSSIRGVLRGLCRAATKGNAQEEAAFLRAFGPETTNAADSAGELLFGDGRLLCLPVRSLFGTFAWISCPLALDRYRRDHISAGLADPGQAAFSAIADDAIVAASSEQRIAHDGKVYLEDLDLAVASDAQKVAAAAALARHIAAAVFDDEHWQGHFAARFGVVSDTAFSFLAETATDVTARIKIEEDTKTVQQGHLWYEEAIPAESIFSTPLLAAPRNGGGSGALFSLVTGQLAELIQLGGHAGVGRGLMRVRVGTAQAAAQAAGRQQ